MRIRLKMTFFCLYIVSLYSCTSPQYSSIDEGLDGGNNSNNSEGAAERSTDSGSVAESDRVTDAGGAPPVLGDASDRVESTIRAYPDASDTVVSRDASFVDAAVQRDADLVPIANPDTSVPQEIETPEQYEDLAWADPLLGRYALRTDSFWLNQNIVVGNVEISLAVFVKEQDKILLRTRMCMRETSWSQRPIEQTSRLINAESLDPRELEVAYDGEHWQSKPRSYYVGFEQEPLVPCEVGEIVPAHESQTWLSEGVCRCYAKEYLPQSPDDCRVVDHDQDGFPGITLEITGTVNNMYYTTTIRSDRYVKGTIDPSGNHQALEAQSSPGSLLACQDPNPLTCSIGETVLCKPEVNRVRFVPIESTGADGLDWNCESVVANSTTLFTSPVSEISADDC